MGWGCRLLGRVPLQGEGKPPGGVPQDASFTTQGGPRLPAAGQAAGWERCCFFLLCLFHHEGGAQQIPLFDFIFVCCSSVFETQPRNSVFNPFARQDPRRLTPGYGRNLLEFRHPGPRRIKIQRNPEANGRLEQTHWEDECTAGSGLCPQGAHREAAPPGAHHRGLPQGVLRIP